MGDNMNMTKEERQEEMRVRKAILFVEHIEEHLEEHHKTHPNTEPMRVCCKICNKTIDEIYTENK